MSRVLELSAEDLAAAVNAGQLDPAECVEASLDALTYNASLNVDITLCPETALRRARKGVTGPLAGVPLLVKDMFDVAGVRTTYGSSVFRKHVPRRTAPAVRRLETAGAIVVGKANQHEFAFGVTSQNPHWGTVQNPLRPDRVAGGSSGGNAAAIAARLCLLGLGTDTGGSVRIPSACCGVVGFKPTPGRVSTAGVFPLSPSFDVVGPMARSVRDCAVAYAILTDESVPQPRLRGLTVGVLEPVVHMEQLERLGAQVVSVNLPSLEAEIEPLFAAECAITHSALYPAHRDEYGLDLQLKLESSRTVTVIACHEARQSLMKWKERVDEHLTGIDLVVSPTLGTPVPSIDCWAPDVRAGMARYTRRFNSLGWAAIAIGNFQIAGRDDRTVLAAALAWEDLTGILPVAP